ncbi:DUF305 domain-containing protein [Gracilimonas sp. Q87]|uniref:DUF305 domain-containing protein n=1 Tax=Gracilimonas sp. Q87 TaxID=3384766 RepID=UPI003983E687
MDILKISNIKFSVLFKITVLLFIVLGSVACKSTESANSQTASSDTSETAGMTEAEMEELFWARQDSARMNFTEDDVKFMTGMIAHHSQALIMSRLAPENGASSEIQTLAARIINSQKDEIRLMQTWLRDREQPVPEVHIEGLKLMIHGLGEDHMHMDHTNMMGMLSPQQLQELSEAKGKEFDRLFLKYMIEHHKGAVHMVTELFNTEGATRDEAAFRLASDIQVDQRTEIARMQLMLDKITASK